MAWLYRFVFPECGDKSRVRIGEINQINLSKIFEHSVIRTIACHSVILYRIALLIQGEDFLNSVYKIKSILYKLNNESVSNENVTGKWHEDHYL